MSIKTNYNFKDIEVKDATIKVIRIFGSSKEGWNSLVGVYTQVKESSIKDDKEIEIVTDNLIEEFNFQAPFKEDERGYKTIYDALTLKYGGINV